MINSSLFYYFFKSNFNLFLLHYFTFILAYHNTVTVLTTTIIVFFNIFVGSSSINRQIGHNIAQPIDAKTQKKRIFDAIAASSIISNCTGVETSQSAATWSVNDLINFMETRQMVTCTEDEARTLIQVKYIS